MATKFLEPGGDATFNTSTTTTGGFWTSNGGSSVVTDFVNLNHVKSIKTSTGAYGSTVETAAGVSADAGTRVSFYVYMNTIGSSTQTLCYFRTGGTTIFAIAVTSAGILQLFNGNLSSQLGVNGSTLSAGVWYRISVAYTISSTSVNRFEVFVNGVSNISVTNGTLTNTGTSTVAFGTQSPVTNADNRFSDIYVDNSSSLTDTGNILVTAKRPNANGTTNGFSTQIGSGGSGYGAGHSPQVNERALSTTNGWSMVGAGSAVTEEYNVESFSTGDMVANPSTIVDIVGWAYMSSLAGETVNIILNGVNFSQAITSTNTMYTKAAGYAGYPAGTGTDIGIQTDTSLTTVSLFECGILVAFLAPSNKVPKQNYIRPRLFGPGLAR